LATTGSGFAGCAGDKLPGGRPRRLPFFVRRSLTDFRIDQTITSFAAVIYSRVGRAETNFFDAGSVAVCACGSVVPTRSAVT